MGLVRDLLDLSLVDRRARRRGLGSLRLLALVVALIRPVTLRPVLCLACSVVYVRMSQRRR